MSDINVTSTPKVCRGRLSAESFSVTNSDTNHSQNDVSKVLQKTPKNYSRIRNKPNKQGRNIESVVLGDVRFPAWYSSWYPKELFGDTKRSIKELYVCPRCFAYSQGADQREILIWLKHWQRCKNFTIPGEKIYVHGGWLDIHKDEENTNTEIWSVWEVDGATETLFCQKLSLFSKLFLDNKSVFFDLSGFKFFLLVCTPPTTKTDLSSKSQIIGYFSKEKMSWDNNNLACILIFPPWQRKGLGSLLIGISYEIARRENILGSPERPISDLGMKGYRGFWGKEIARFLLNWNENTNPYLSIETISRETWISLDDCLATIQEMNIIDCGVEAKYVANGVHKIQSKITGDGDNFLNEDTRILLDKQRVRDWVVREGLQLKRVVCESGFRPGYALERSHKRYTTH